MKPRFLMGALMPSLFICAVLIELGCSKDSGKNRNVEDFIGTWKSQSMKLDLKPDGGIVEIRMPQNSLHLTGASIKKKQGDFTVSFVSPARVWNVTLSDDGKKMEMVAQDNGERATLEKQ
jgi:hypothetical protein